MSFVALLVYGANRSEQPRSPKRPCEQMPKLEPGEDPDPDRMEDWCPPDVAKSFTRKTRGLQARFAEGLGIEPVTLRGSPQQDVSFPVPPSEEEARAARITLVAGDWAILRGKDQDEQLCLCRPGTRMDDRLFASKCDHEWKLDHTARAPPNRQRICQKHDDSGMLPFRREPSQVTLLRGPAATIRIE